MTTTAMEPWQWPEPHWRKLVNQVRAGRSYRPDGWKNGARCAFALSFDADHETNELRDGGKSIGRMAWGEYGTRVGVPRILKLLKKYDVRLAVADSVWGGVLFGITKGLIGYLKNKI